VGLFSLWHVLIDSPGSHIRQHLVHLGISPSGERLPRIERLGVDLLQLNPHSESYLGVQRISTFVNNIAPEMLHRELTRIGLLQEGSSYSSRLIACVELHPQ
jgi:hypothetical protein